MQVVCCDDNTCKYNKEEFCKNPFPTIKVGKNDSHETCNICESYEDRRKEDVGTN